MIMQRIFSGIGKRVASTFMAVAFICVHAEGARAQDADLAKSLSNPLAALISVPFQFNYNQGYGTANGDQLLLNIQPVIPISLNDEWNLISRTIVPVI
jgi:hypothetical protein